MTLADLGPLANHLWQSTLCVPAAWLLTWALRRNRAKVRYSVWLAASVKFLIPFSLLVSAGSHFGWRTAPVIEHSQVTVVMQQIGQPFVGSLPVTTTEAAPSSVVPGVLLGVWLCGIAIGAGVWFRWWNRMRMVQRSAMPLPMGLPVRVLSSPERLEPGIFGIRKPVLLLPEGIADRLTAAQLDAVLAHELCHVRRQDNLTAAIHMLVETIFWFHPLVWWIRARMVEERERACDEFVLGASSDPNTYAEGILNVCKFYLEAPVVCVSGVTGSDLKKRIERIVTYRPARRLGLAKTLVLAAAGIAAVAGPVGLGVMNAPAAQAQSPASAHLEFDVASVKANHSGREGHDGFKVSHGSLRVENVSLKMLIEEAYNLQGAQIVGGPAWMSSERFDVIAKGAPDASKQQVWLMLQSLLVTRFKFRFQIESRDLPLYSLETAKSGVKMPRRDDADCPEPKPEDGKFHEPCGGVAALWGPRGAIIFGGRVSTAQIADALAGFFDRPVVDRTGLTGLFDVNLNWTPEGYQPGPRNENEPRRVEPMGEPAPPIFTAVQEQLGLKLVSTKGPVKVFVVQQAEKPAEN